MAWGKEIKPAEYCYACKEPMDGTASATVGSYGWGNSPRTEEIACCINPACEVGKKNLPPAQ
ncbi:MAG: hypothetical protein PHW95_02740 [Patescibacteria group bacterium]|nr:hypothetical protein [Patescibacteria group bacterium]